MTAHGATDCVFCELLRTGDACWVARAAEAVAFLPLPGTRSTHPPLGDVHQRLADAL